MFFGKLIDLLFNVFYLMIIVRVIVSWVRPPIKDQRIIKALKLIYQYTEPVLEPIRRILPKHLVVDLSPLVALILLSFLKTIILGILY